MNEGEQSEVVLLRDNRLTQRPAGADDELGELDVLVAEISLRDGDECRKVELRRIDPRERDFVRRRLGRRRGLTCGGILDVYVERVDRTGYPELGAVAGAIREGTPVAVLTCVAAGAD